MKKKIIYLLIIAVCIWLNACSKSEENLSLNVETEVSEENFEWDGNVIIALSEKGTKQKTIVIPERCEGFNGMIFADKENSVTSVYFESDKDIELNGVFGCAEKLSLIELPNELTSIGDLDFWLCSSLEKISIPSGVTSIGAYAFQNNTNLSTVIFQGNISNIMAHAFEGCVALEEIIFPNSISVIGEYAFYGCTALRIVELPESLVEVGDYAFANSGLEQLRVPENVALTKYSTTSFTQADKNVVVYVKEKSWMDQNFDVVFNGAFEKKYND